MRQVYTPREGKPLRVRLAYALVGIALFPALIVSVVLSFNSIEFRQNDVWNRLDDTSSTLAKKVESHLYQNTNGVRQLADGITKAGGFDDVGAGIEFWLKDFHRLYPDFLTVLAADQSGAVLHGG